MPVRGTPPVGYTGGGYPGGWWVRVPVLGWVVPGTGSGTGPGPYSLSLVPASPVPGPASAVPVPGTGGTSHAGSCLSGCLQCLHDELSLGSIKVVNLAKVVKKVNILVKSGNFTKF